MTEWQPDTCECKLNVEDKAFIKKCDLHKNSLADDVIAHNQSFNLKYGRKEKLTEEEEKEMKRDKASEKVRSKG